MDLEVRGVWLAEVEVELLEPEFPTEADNVDLGEDEVIEADSVKEEGRTSLSFPGCGFLDERED